MQFVGTVALAAALALSMSAAMAGGRSGDHDLEHSRFNNGNSGLIVVDASGRLIGRYIRGISDANLAKVAVKVSDGTLVHLSLKLLDRGEQPVDVTQLALSGSSARTFYEHGCSGRMFIERVVDEPEPITGIRAGFLESYDPKSETASLFVEKRVRSIKSFVIMASQFSGSFCTPLDYEYRLEDPVEIVGPVKLKLKHPLHVE